MPTEEVAQLVERTLAFGRYLSWADLMRRLYEDEIQRSPTEEDERRDQEWRSFGLMCYWYSSLNVALEGYADVAMRDQIVDKILAHPLNLKGLLRRYRNGVFHAQASLLDRRFIDLLETDELHVWWIQALHDELVRAYADYLDSLMATDAQRAEMRETVENILNWYPYRLSPSCDALERTVSICRRMLAESSGHESTERGEFIEALESAEGSLFEARRRWHVLRAYILGRAGVE